MEGIELHVSFSLDIMVLSGVGQRCADIKSARDSSNIKV
jgi:hypothetical protein